MTDQLSARVFAKLYRDSVTLMALASAAQRIEGVVQVGAVMATPANLAILRESAMLPSEITPAPDDLLIVVRAADERSAEEALSLVEAGLTSAESAPGTVTEVRPATVREGLSRDDALTVAAVSTPGTYAPVVVEQALRSGLHVFCFSDNVPVEDEIRLKQLAVSSGRLLMGPDCGTAVLDGVPLGFANVLRPGPVAIVAASGTGAQEVSCLLDAAGIGVAQVIGVGGRDLTAEVGGLMTNLALDLVSADPEVAAVVLVSKPPAPAVAAQVLDRLASLGRPAVACLLGEDDTDGPVAVRGTLEGGAAAVAHLLGRALDLDEGPAAARGDRNPPTARGILGLYTGGTLAGETKVILRRAGVTAQVLDLGDDEYTAGRPHPMIDPAARADRVAAAGGQADIGLVLVDLVLGHGSADDPATPLADAAARAIADARADGRELWVIGSVCGTPADPQGRDGQRRILEDAGILVFASNAAAARFAAELATSTAEVQK
jgi:FdrA protein